MKKEPPSVQRIAELQQLIADFSSIERVLRIADKGRFENDVEHSFGLALTCWFIAPKIAPELDMQKILQYSLAHDIVELHAGDTYIFDEDKIKTKFAREDQAIKQLQKEWPDFPELTDASQSYKDRTDDEAEFVYVIDKMLPAIMVNIGEKDKFWNRHKVTREMLEAEKRKKMTTTSPASIYTQKLLKWLRDPDYYYKPVEKG